MKYIINYSCGGVGNRLKPLGSCYNLSKITDRILGIVWYSVPRCMAPFNSLYKNEMPIIDLKTLDINDISIYSEPEWILHDRNLNGTTELYNIFTKIGCTRLADIKNVLTDTKKYIIVYSNTFLDGYEDIKEFLKTLIPVDDIQQKIDAYILENKIDKSIIGVQARGTDFIAMSPNVYCGEMGQYIDKRFYVCSDSKEMEDAIKQTFGDRVLTRPKVYVSKINNGNHSWINNVMTPTDSVKDAIVDLYILSKTDFKVYNKGSTFADIVKLLN